MMGTSSSSSGGGFDSLLLLEIVSILGDKSKYTDKLNELVSKVVESEKNLHLAIENNKAAQATREEANAIQAEVADDLNTLAKEREQHTYNFNILRDKQAVVKEGERYLEELKAAFAKQKVDFEDYSSRKNAEHDQREKVVKQLELDTHAKVAIAHKRMETDRDALMSKANATLRAAEARREEAEARMGEAVKLHKEGAERLNRLLELASGKQSIKGDVNG